MQALAHTASCGTHPPIMERKIHCLPPLPADSLNSSSFLFSTVSQNSSDGQDSANAVLNNFCSVMLQKNKYINKLINREKNQQCGSSESAQAASSATTAESSEGHVTFLPNQERCKGTTAAGVSDSHTLTVTTSSDRLTQAPPPSPPLPPFPLPATSLLHFQPAFLRVLFLFAPSRHQSRPLLRASTVNLSSFHL